MNAMIAVMKKELLDLFRDRKTIFNPRKENFLNTPQHKYSLNQWEVNCTAKTFRLRSMALLDGQGHILASTQAGEAGLQIEVQQLLPDNASAPVLGKVQLGRLVSGRSLSSLTLAPHAIPRGVHYLPQILAFENDSGAPAVLVGLIALMLLDTQLAVLINDKTGELTSALAPGATVITGWRVSV